MLTSDKHQIIYYSFKVPDVPDKQIPIDTLEKAIDTWEKYNSNLEFIESENSNIEINWQNMNPQLTLDLQHTILFYLEF